MVMNNKDIDFVVRHYRQGRFSAAAGWRRLGIGRAAAWRRFRVAAAVAAIIVVSATAAVVFRQYYVSDSAPETVTAPAVSPLQEVKVIDFDNASLEEVVAKIESTYGVEVNNLPADEEQYSLSLHYQGNPAELIEVINEILGTEMTVTEK